MAEDPIWEEDNGEGLRTKIQSGELTLQAAIDSYAENAAELDKPNIVRALLDSGMDVNLIIKGDFLLFIAAAEASVNVVKLLIERGADVNKKNDQGDTSLLIACNAEFAGNDEQIANLVTVVNDLIEADANPNIVDVLGNSPLMIACRTGLTAVAILLADYDDVDVNLKNNEGNTALIIAAEKGNVDIVRELVSAGVNANKNIKNNAGKTAYDVATNEEIKKMVGGSRLIRLIKEKKTAEALALIDGGADVNERDETQSTPLMWATIKRNVEVVRKLLEKGADVNAKNIHGLTPLYFGIEYSHVIFRIILERNPDVNASGVHGGSLLSYVIFQGLTDWVEPLLNKGADPTIGRGADTLLHEVITRRRLLSENTYDKVAELLVNKGADLNVKDEDENTPLISALLNKTYNIANIILTKDQDLNVQTRDYGNTALMIAARDGQTEVVRTLIEKGANKNIKNNAGKTAYDFAANEEIKALVFAPPRPYSGKTKSDIDYLEVFLGKTDAVTSEATAMDSIKNMTVCPVCNAIDSRGPGCMYMYHVCKKRDRHEELYQKYKGWDGMIWWCVYCGRICDGHKHYRLGLVSDSSKPGVFPAGSPFAFSCDNSDERDINGYVREVRLDDGTIRRDNIPPAVTNSGGNIREKLMRISRMVEYMFELQHFKGEISAKEARKEIIEEMWNAPMFRMRFDPLKVKKWKTDLSVFKDDAPSAEVIPEAVPAPGDIEDPVIHDEPEVESSLLDEPPIIEFKHKNKVGVMFNHVHGDAGDDKRFIGKDSLITFMRTMGEKLGKCFDDDCGGWLWPQEIAKAFEDPRLGVTDADKAVLASYKERFNSAKAAKVGGGRAEWKFNHFTGMDDAMCYLPPKGKKAGNRTRKNKIKRAKKTRRN